MTGFTPRMSHIGTISGVGDAHVFGLARHTVDQNRTDTIYLNLAGPATSVESIWARILERHSVTFNPANPSISPRPLGIRHGGLGGDETPFVRFQQRIPSLSLDHLILLDRRFTQVEYGDVGIAFVFNKDDAYRKIYEHVHQLINLACFPEWEVELTRIGYRTGLIKSVQSLGGQEVYMINLDRTLWQTRIAVAVERGELIWPNRKGEIKEMNVPLHSPSDILGVVQRGTPVEVPQLPQSAQQPVASPISPVIVPPVLPAAAARVPAIQPMQPSIPPEASTLPSKSISDVSYQITHDGDWTWLSFTGKPDEDVRNALKRAGFRWGQRRMAWYARRNVADAEVEKMMGNSASASETSRISTAPSVDIPVGGKRSPYFKSISHYTQKRAAKVIIAEAFRKAGWTICGWHEDRSDAMTDYFAPASWDGVAIKDDCVVVVDGDYAATHRSGTEGWPTFKATPGGNNWHVEYKGQIVAQGKGLARCCREYYEGGEVLSYTGAAEPKLRPEQKAAQGFVERIDVLRSWYENQPIQVSQE